VEGKTKVKVAIGSGILFVSVLCLYVWYKRVFLRQPNQLLAAAYNPTKFLSPANGTVVSVRAFDSNSDFIENKYDTEDNIAGAIKLFAGDVDTAGTIMSIHMGLDNVHYQVCPLDATVDKIEYVSGNHKNAISKSPDGVIRYENEHCSYLFQTSIGIKYKVVQIAGFVARKIESYVSEGQQVNQGDQIGVIKLGSQVTVILPSSISCMVKVGDVVDEGKTIMGTLV